MKQYVICAQSSYGSVVQLYEDGVGSKKQVVWDLHDKIKHLEEQGYTRAYTDEDIEVQRTKVEKALAIYENMIIHKLKSKESSNNDKL